jgi:hypothetical protein
MGVARILRGYILSNPINASALTRNVTAQLAQIAAQPACSENLGSALRLLAKWRSQVLLNTIVKRDGPAVQTGPFAGMIYPNAASEGAGATRLLGCYEASLTPIITQIVSGQYRQVIDVGCAEGYYAVGLARMMPEAQIIARDANPQALTLCAALAATNGVADRISCGGMMSHADFALCHAAKTVVICDIEGGEASLLDPTLAPGLLQADILVETHDCIQPGLSDLISARFAASHHIQRIDRMITPSALPDWMADFSDLDRLLALWEWRTGPTPWLWMTRKDPK